MHNRTQNFLITIILTCVRGVVWVRSLFGFKPEKWSEKSNNQQTS